MTSSDISAELRSTVADAFEQGAALEIQGGGTKQFYGRRPTGSLLRVNGHQGIVNYEPTELVVSVRSGTRLSELQQILAEAKQMLGFEAPAFGADATVGGMVACGFSGPARPYRGAVRDAVLGVQIINGRGQQLRFGGEVIKNVAGYDASRLMVGAMGTLGVLLQVSLKVLPAPEVMMTRTFEMTEVLALKQMNAWAGRPLPLSACSFYAGRLSVRLGGSGDAVLAAGREIGGDEEHDAMTWWESLREQTLPFFARKEPLWRLSVPPATEPMNLPGDCLIDWGGAQRWLFCEHSVDVLRQVVRDAGGHATLFRGGNRDGEIFEPLQSVQSRLQQELKKAFDPRSILNPGRMVEGW